MLCKNNHNPTPSCQSMPAYCFMFLFVQNMYFLTLFLFLNKTPVTPEWRPLQRSHSVQNIADIRGACCAVASNAVYALCALCHASPRTPRVGNYLEHAQRQCCGLAFAQRARQRAVRRLWQHCEVF